VLASLADSELPLEQGLRLLLEATLASMRVRPELARRLILEAPRDGRFDLGRYPEGETKQVTFDQKGRVDVYCEIHEHMRGFILVVDHPYFAVTREDGSYTIPGVPLGKYAAVAWHEGFEPVRREIEVKPDGARADLKLARRADVSIERAAGAGCCSGR
jgi:hypothetical protein